MKLKEAWYKILNIPNAQRLTNKIIYSILADYGVFVESPYSRLVVKSALEYCLWDLITSNSSQSDLSIMKLKLKNDGFTDKVIFDLIQSFSNNVAQSEVDISTQNKNIGLTSKTIDISNVEESHISFMGKELGCPIDDLIKYLINRKFAIIFKSYVSVNMVGVFAGKPVKIILSKTPMSLLVSKVTVKSISHSFIQYYDTKYHRCEPDKHLKPIDFKKESGNTLIRIYYAKGGQICIEENISGELVIKYIDNELNKLWETEFREYNIKKNEEYDKRILSDI